MAELRTVFLRLPWRHDQELLTKPIIYELTQSALINRAYIHKYGRSFHMMTNIVRNDEIMIIRVDVKIYDSK